MASGDDDIMNVDDKLEGSGEASDSDEQFRLDDAVSYVFVLFVMFSYCANELKPV